MEIHASILKQSELLQPDREQLYMLHQQYYDNVRLEIFLKDLSEKDWVIVIRDNNGQLQGFSTIQLIRLKINNADHLYLFSGDTIIREEARNTHALSGAFIHFMYALVESYPGTPIHWFLITKGYRTYRFLPVYFNEYYPVHDKPVPEYYQQVLDTVAFHKFGDQYHPADHLIRFKTQKDRLKPQHALINEGRLKDTEIQFFLKKNPFFYRGDELTCITDISAGNFKPLVERIWKCSRVNFKWTES